MKKTKIILKYICKILIAQPLVQSISQTESVITFFFKFSLRV